MLWLCFIVISSDQLAIFLLPIYFTLLEIHQISPPGLNSLYYVRYGGFFFPTIAACLLPQHSPKAVPSHADTASAAAGAAVHAALQKPNLHPIASTSVSIYHHSPLSALLFPCGQGWGQTLPSVLYIFYIQTIICSMCAGWQNASCYPLM